MGDHQKSPQPTTPKQQGGGERIFALTSFGRIISNPNLLKNGNQEKKKMSVEKQQREPLLHWSDEDESTIPIEINKTGNSSFNDFLYDNKCDGTAQQQQQQQQRRIRRLNDTSNDVPDMTDEEADIQHTTANGAGSTLDQNVGDTRSTEKYSHVSNNFEGGDVTGTTRSMLSVDDEGKTRETFDSRDFKDRSDGYFDRSIEQIYQRYDDDQKARTIGIYLFVSPVLILLLSFICFSPTVLTLLLS